jgi:phosphopantetheinyl transferase
MEVMMEHTAIYQLNFRRQTSGHTAYLSLCSRLLPYIDAASVLSKREQLQYEGYSGGRQSEYLLSRWLTKDLVRRFYIERSWKDIEVASSVFGQPVLCDTGCGHNLRISISHKKELAGSLVFDAEHPMALDIEQMQDPASLLRTMEEDELEALDRHGLSAMHAWSAKEALSKVLGCGITVDRRLFKTQDWQQQENCYTGEYKHFLQYRFVGFIVNEHIITLAFPRNSEIEIKLFNPTSALYTM